MNWFFPYKNKVSLPCGKDTLFYIEIRKLLFLFAPVEFSHTLVA